MVNGTRQRKARQGYNQGIGHKFVINSLKTPEEKKEKKKKKHEQSTNKRQKLLKWRQRVFDSSRVSVNSLRDFFCR